VFVLQVLQRCSDAELQQHWQECATLAGLKFDWRDTVDPLAAAQAAAYALHYYEPQQVGHTNPSACVLVQQPLAACRDAFTPANWLVSLPLALTRNLPQAMCACPMFPVLRVTVRELPPQVLSGPVLMTGPFDAGPVRWFLQQLTPASMNVFYSSRRHSGSTDSKEPFYGAQYSAEPLPQTYLDAASAYAAVDEAGGKHAAAAVAVEQQQQQQQHEVSVDVGRQEQAAAGQQQFNPLPGELFLPPANWAIPTDFALRQQDKPGAAGGAAGAVGEAAPACVVQQRGLCAWHKLDISFGLPKASLWAGCVSRHLSAQCSFCLSLTLSDVCTCPVLLLHSQACTQSLCGAHAPCCPVTPTHSLQVQLKLHIVTPAVYATPAATVSARLLLRVLDDLLLPLAYPAELAGTCYSLSTGQGGLLLKVSGFPGVAQQLLVEVLQALAGEGVGGTGGVGG
jgi:secreted Zn-dependent insulinase-like peptidase